MDGPKHRTILLVTSCFPGGQCCEYPLTSYHAADELKQPFFTEVPSEQMGQCRDLVGHYSPLVGVGDEPIVVTIGGIDYDQTVSHRLGYLLAWELLD